MLLYNSHGISVYLESRYKNLKCSDFRGSWAILRIHLD